MFFRSKIQPCFNNHSIFSLHLHLHLHLHIPIPTAGSMRGSVFFLIQSSRIIWTSSQDCIRHGNINDARRLFDQNDTVAWNSIITYHVRHNQMQHAHQLFDQMPLRLRNAVSWNTIMSGLTDPHQLHQRFLQMKRAGERPNHFTFSTLISGFLNSSFHVFLVPQLHALILDLGLHSNVFVASALMRGYTRLRDPEGLCRVFHDVLVKDVSTWNALVVGYMDLGFTVKAQIAFDMMPEVNIISWTTLVNGYIKNGNVNRARSIFNEMTQKNVVSWTAMIKGYVQNGKYVDAIQLFMSMLKSGTHPNHFTFSTLLDACAGCSMFLFGKQLHSWIFKSGMCCEVVLLTSLIDMYTKCGDIGAALCIFESMENKNTVSWNSIIGGCASHGLAKRALCEFEKMTESGVKPDHVTYINLLSACVHGGLVEEGERHFHSMGVTYGIQAAMKHYTCMVDLYGKAGALDKAEKLVKEMPFEPDVGVWCALLAACGLHSCYELGDFAANGLENLARQNAGIYSMLMKLHREKGAWSRVIEMKNKMMETSAKKQKAGSRIEFVLKKQNPKSQVG